jgi:hypothetical protein
MLIAALARSHRFGLTLAIIWLLALCSPARAADSPRPIDDPLFLGIPVALSPLCGFLGDCAHFDAISLKVGIIGSARGRQEPQFAAFSGWVRASVSLLDLAEINLAFGGHVTRDETGNVQSATMPGWLSFKLRAWPLPWVSLRQDGSLQVAVAYQRSFVSGTLGAEEPPGFSTNTVRLLSSRSYGPVDVDVGLGAVFGSGAGAAQPDLRRAVEAQIMVALRLFGLARPVTPEEQLRVVLQALYRFPLPGDGNPSEGYAVAAVEEKTHSGYRFGLGVGPYLLGSRVGGIALLTVSVAWGPRYSNPVAESWAGRERWVPRAFMDWVHVDPVLDSDGCVYTDPSWIGRMRIACVGHPDPQDPKTIVLYDGRRLAVGTHLWIRNDGMLITQMQEDVAKLDADTASHARFVQKLIHQLGLTGQREGKPCQIKADFLYGASESAFAPVLGFPSEGGMGAQLGQTLDRWITCGPDAQGGGPFGLPPIIGGLALSKGTGRPLRLRVTEPGEAEHIQPVQPARGALDPSARAHIFYGEVDPKYGKSRGWHYEPSADSKKGTYVIEETRSVPDKHGVYEANVVIEGINKNARSSFFPKEWSQEHVEKAILEAYTDRQPTNTGRFRGYSSEGVEIELWIDSKGNVTSAYPIPERGP